MSGMHDWNSVWTWEHHVSCYPDIRHHSGTASSSLWILETIYLCRCGWNWLVYRQRTLVLTGQSSKGRRCQTVPGSFFFPTMSDFLVSLTNESLKKRRSRDLDTEEEPKTPNGSISMAAVDLSQARYNMPTRNGACSGTLPQETPVWLLVYTAGLDAQYRRSWIMPELFKVFLGAVQNITGILRQRGKKQGSSHAWLACVTRH